MQAAVQADTLGLQPESLPTPGAPRAKRTRGDIHAACCSSGGSDNGSLEHQLRKTMPLLVDLGGLHSQSPVRDAATSVAHPTQTVQLVLDSSSTILGRRRKRQRQVSRIPPHTHTVWAGRVRGPAWCVAGKGACVCVPASLRFAQFYSLTLLSCCLQRWYATQTDAWSSPSNDALMSDICVLLFIPNMYNACRTTQYFLTLPLALLADLFVDGFKHWAKRTCINMVTRRRKREGAVSSKTLYHDLNLPRLVAGRL